MARIFTLNFEFQHHSYTALVLSSTGNDGNIRYTVSLNDDPLKQMLPNGRISFGQLSDLRSLADVHPRINELVLSLSSALHQRLLGEPEDKKEMIAHS